jgi:hypothetical protein
MAQQRRTELETWPTVQAHVDSAAVVPWHGASHQAVYAKRLWLSYTYDGHAQTRRLDGIYSNDWSKAAHAVDSARARGTAALLIDPAHPTHITLDPGYTFDFFLWPVVLAGIGLVFLLLGLSTGMSARRARSSQQTSSRDRTTPVMARPAFLAVIGVLFAGTGVSLLVHAVHQRVHWDTVEARVDSAGVVQRRADRHGTYYAPRLWITYEHDGHTYHRPVLTGAAWTRDPISVRQHAEAAWHAGPTRAFVNPSDPYQATLDPTSGGSLLLPLAFTLVGLGLLVFAAQRRKSARRSMG